jgi:hypothetical protein
MAETELSVLSRQCLDRRIDSKELMEQETGDWEEHRNRACSASIGDSQPPMPVSSSSGSIRRSRGDRALGCSHGRFADLCAVTAPLGFKT